MSDEDYEIQTETESEEGGVVLPIIESDEVDIGHDSALSSISQPTDSAPSALLGSPPQSTLFSHIQNLTPSGHAAVHEHHSVSTAEPSAVPPAEISLSSWPLSDVSSVPHDASWAEEVSGQLSTIPQDATLVGTDFLDGGSQDDQNPFLPPFGTLPTFSTSLDFDAFVSQVPGLDSNLAAEGVTQSMNQNLPNTLHSFTTDTSPSVPSLSFPYLIDVSESDFPSHDASHSIDPSNQTEDLSPIDVFTDFTDPWDNPYEDNLKNFNLEQFFHYWKQMYAQDVPDYPSISDSSDNLQDLQRPDTITAQDFGNKEDDDFQSLLWTRLQITRKDAREVRRMTYRNHTNILGVSPTGFYSKEPAFGTPAFKARFCDINMPKSDSCFRFQQMNMKCKPSIAHFQLRHNLFATSQKAVFYGHRPKKQEERYNIRCYNPTTNSDECAMDLIRVFEKDAARLPRETTLTAGDGVLVVGGLDGVYAIKALSANSDNAPTTGVITTDPNGSTNHVHTFLDRQSGLPQAVFDSNDRTIQVLDITTNKFVRRHCFPFAVNCSATSPDGRLRILVGDDIWPMVVNAETGERLAKLPHHKDYGFACTWSPDGVTMATGHQDGIVQIWDARKLTESIHVIAMQMGGCRAMQFSPIGSGKRILVLAEPADFVHVVDARTFSSEQEIDFFGEIGGISMPPDGSSLFIGNSDPTHGGIMEFGRSWNSELYGSMDFTAPQDRSKEDMNEVAHDWLPDWQLEEDDRVWLSGAYRQRRCLDLGSTIF